MTKHHRPRKRFGQHFLHDANIIQKIIDAIGIRSSDHITEIGPGQGAITDLIIDNCHKLDLVEIDRDIIKMLNVRYADKTNINIHSADALAFDFQGLAKNQKLRVVGNLPYNISTPLIFHLLESIECIEDMHFMLQKEVVDRMSATVHSADYSRLSVMVQYFCQVEPLFTVSANCFTPPPKVLSSVVRLTPIQRDVPAKSTEIFTNLIRQAFHQRRKTLRNNLSGLVDAKRLVDVGIDPQLRPQQLSVEDYITISNLL